MGFEQLAGIQHTYKKLSKTLAKCLVCGEYSECQIIKYEESSHIFFIKLKVRDEQFWFDWRQCNHRAMLFDKQDVSRYKQEQVETGILSVPYYQNMKIRTMIMAQKITSKEIVIMILFILLGALLGLILEILGIHVVF